MFELVPLLSAWLAMVALMGVLWGVQRKTGAAGSVDVAWSLGTGLCAAYFCWVADGSVERRMVVAALAVAWGTRLGIALLRRLLHEKEDGRYTMLKEKWGDRAQAMLFGFFQIQALWAVLFALPMWGAAMNAAPWGVTDWLGVAVWLGAVGMEWVADRQLYQFKMDPANRGKVCDVGLWAYSRHPNYFFEWLHWFSYILFAWGGSGWYLPVLGMGVMLWFLLKITGIPMTERRALANRGEAYRQYQLRVSAFVPLPQRKVKES